MSSIEYKIKDNNPYSNAIDLANDISGATTLADLLLFTKEALISIAKQALVEEQTNGFDKYPVTLVDRSKNKSIQDVSPLGSIEFIARANIWDLVVEAFDTVLRLSKVVTGEYIDSHQVLHNNKVVALTRGELIRYLEIAELSENDYWTIANSAAYARRLETLGVSAKGSNPKRKEVRYKNRRRGGGKIRITKPPNGAYALSYTSLKARIGKFVEIKFRYVTGDTLGLSGKFKRGTFSQRGRPYLYPVIVISDPRGSTLI